MNWAVAPGGGGGGRSRTTIDPGEVRELARTGGQEAKLVGPAQGRRLLPNRRPLKELQLGGKWAGKHSPISSDHLSVSGSRRGEQNAACKI